MRSFALFASLLALVAGVLALAAAEPQPRRIAIVRRGSSGNQHHHQHVAAALAKRHGSCAAAAGRKHHVKAASSSSSSSGAIPAVKAKTDFGNPTNARQPEQNRPQQQVKPPTTTPMTTTKAQTQTQVPQPAKETQAPPPSNSNNGNNGGGGGGGSGSHTGGDLTFFSTGLGACGLTNNDGEAIVAVSHLLFDTFQGGSPGGNPNKNPICGKKIKAFLDGKSTIVKVVDRCAGCNNINSLDMTPSSFSQLAEQTVGRVVGKMTWEFLD